MTDVDIRKLQATVETALLDLARYHRGEAEVPTELEIPPSGMSGGESTKAWTKAVTDYFSRRLSVGGLRTERGRAARLCVPPDLVVFGPTGSLLVHVEHETRGWEWNHAFGDLIKLMFVNDEMSRIAVLVLNEFDKDCGEEHGLKRRLDILLNTCQRLLPAARDFVSLYLAIWLRNHDARVFQIVPTGNGIERTEPRCLFPAS
jgi:hypothetical protein